MESRNRVHTGSEAESFRGLRKELLKQKNTIGD